MRDLPNDDSANAGPDLQLGRRVILPSSYVHGPRHYHQLYQDAMAVVQRYGKPTIFWTFTANPTWTEISRELFDGQTPANRPGLVARVFQMKLKSLMKDIDDGCFSPLRAVFYSFVH